MNRPRPLRHYVNRNSHPAGETVDINTDEKTTAANGMTEARIGDWILEPSRSYNQRGLIVGVYSSRGTPPYLVHWQDDGRDSMIEPGPDTQLVHAPR
jgi:Domain of unknown function (DUF1918)